MESWKNWIIGGTALLALVAFTNIDLSSPFGNTEEVDEVDDEEVDEVDDEEEVTEGEEDKAEKKDKKEAKATTALPEGIKLYVKDGGLVGKLAEGVTWVSSDPKEAVVEFKGQQFVADLTKTTAAKPATSATFKPVKGEEEKEG